MKDLLQWLNNPSRRPLILRGARQTGKTYVIRQLAKEAEKSLVEINFERDPQLGELFKSTDPNKIITALEVTLGVDISVGSCILFLDEIQACAHVLSSLRWFYEDLPDLPVVAAGSLLEFALDDYEDSMPVGRVTYMYLHPFNFTEFLWAIDENRKADYLQDVREHMEMPETLHQQYIELYRQYCITGGMPAVVREWSQHRNIQACIQLQKDLITSFRDDFNKYRRNIQPDVLRKTLESVAYQLGSNFVYSIVDRDTKQPLIKKALDMLDKAGLCKRVYASSGNGIPLGAEINNRIFKVIFLDIGLALSTLGVCPIDLAQLDHVIWSNKGALAEQVCGQLLLSDRNLSDEPLYFWQRSGVNTAEIDYLTQNDGIVLPIEVKAGVSGSMKSLHTFMESKKLSDAVRFDLNKPSVQYVQVRTTEGLPTAYRLLSLPLYMVEYL